MTVEATEVTHPHPHPHPHRRAERPTMVDDLRPLHHPNPFVRFNAYIGLKITIVVGTMWAAYVFAAIALVSLKDNLGSTAALILWISSSFLQLVLLPIIIVGQNIQAKASDKRAEDTYKDADAILHEAEHIQAHLAAQDAEINKILGQLRQMTGPPAPGAATSPGGTAPATT